MKEKPTRESIRSRVPLQTKNIDATACRAWPRLETFNGLQKMLQIVYRAQNLVHLSSLRSGNFHERIKKKNEVFLRKMKNVFLAENRRRHT